MKRYILAMVAIAILVPAIHAQDDFDDIYYNPKKDNRTEDSYSKSRKQDKQSNYIADFGDVDVDQYNRRGDFYYATAIDTIGQQTENGEDFVYTQQIQKFYNPTIVVENADVLADLLEDSYGNVDIVIDNGYPAFTSVYTGGYAWTPSYYNWCMTPSWRWNHGCGTAYPSWIWGPSWTWGWDPYWAWSPSWSWGWGPSWGYYPPRPGWGPGHGLSYGYHRPNPGATRPVSPNAGWSANTRPGGVYNGRGGSSVSRRPTYGTSRPINGETYVSRPGHRVSSSASGVGGSGSGNTINGTRRWGGVDKSTVAADKKAGTVTNNNRGYGVGGSKSNGTGRGYSTGRPKTNTNSGYSTSRNNSNNNRSYDTTNSNRSYNTTNSNRSYNSGSSYRTGGNGGSGTGRATSGGGRGGGHRSGGRR